MAAPTSPALARALHDLEVAMLHVFASKCLAIAGFCVLCYDHSLTFSDEVESIWRQNRSLVSILFILIRYVTPLVLIVDIYDKGGLTHYIPNSFCLGWYYGETAWNLCAFALIHGLVALRVRAIWGRPRWLSATLSVLFAVYFVTTAVIAYKYQIEFGYTVAYNQLFHVCFAQISPHIWACWLPALVFESFLFILTLIKAIEHSRKKINTPVLYVLYRDGIVYFIVICCCSIFNMMVWLLAPPTLVALSKYFVLSIVPAMGSRLVLNLRSSRSDDIMPTGRSTADENAYEMHPSKGLSQKSYGNKVGSFSPKVEVEHRSCPPWIEPA
ncbi:unnamed protein product [Rhizoctonia solani]|uniref:DUF6533 domain-containing protein n=1 Tax=Rhizoctonia solani TaxID=456999 RepID=A0A8H2WB46_9AGAM|nr:unnamed protein product [Rhizoctonia solani]